MKVIYTTTGKEELEKFRLHSQYELEKLIADRKLVFGDDVLEITASDVKNAAARIRPIPSSKPLNRARVVAQTYFVMGTLLIVGAANYNWIAKLIHEQPMQAVAMAAGALMILTGLAAKWYLRLKEEEVQLMIRREELLDSEFMQKMQELRSEIESDLSRR